MDEKFLAEHGVNIDRTSCTFPVLEVKNSAGSAKISLYGGHVLSYAPAGERPVLWMSSKSNFETGKAIRGGVPVCWPWFGPSARPGLPAHGFARIAMWELLTVRKLAGDATQIVLMLDDSKCDPALCTQKFRLELAEELLLLTEYPIKTIANMCGYEHPFAFSRSFRRATGVSPAEFRKTKGRKYTPTL